MAKPVAGDDHAQIDVDDADHQITGNLLANDTDPDGGTLYLRFVNGIRVGDKGTDTIVGTYGTFKFNADGTYTYTLDTLNPAVASLGPGETLKETLNYKISDGNGETDYALFTLEIGGPNQRPTANDDFYGIDADLADGTVGNVLSNLFGTDTDPDGDTLQVAFIGEGSPLTYIPNDGGTVDYEGQYGTITIGRDGDFVYDIDETDPAVIAARADGGTLSEYFLYKIWDGGPTNSADQGALHITLFADGA
jgi:VCBS repeat-containing protein